MERILGITVLFVATVSAAVVNEFDMLDLEPAIVSAPTKKNYGFKPMVADEDFGYK